MAARSSGAIAFTEPAVPTGMNRGVSPVPGGSRSLPRLARPSRWLTENEITGALYDQHRVAVAEESILLPHGLAVGGEDAVEAREGRDQHEERRARQMEVGEEPVDRAEPVAGRDEEIGRAGPCAEPAAVARRREGAERRGPDRDHAPAILAGAVPRFGRLARHRVPL